MATTFTYRCICGFEFDKKMSGRPPETFQYGEHPAGGESRTLCTGILKRVWGNARMNLGYQPVKHNSSQHWLFKHG